MATVALGAASQLTKRQLYQQTISALHVERASFEGTWSELAENQAPRRIRRSTTDRNRGDRRDSLIYDNTVRRALRTLQSGLHAGITSPARPWFKLTTFDPDLAEQGDVKQWLHMLTQRIHTVFLRSNLYNVLPILYGDLGCFGTGALAILEDDEDMLRGYSYPLMSFAFGLDARGVATTFVREYRRTARQLIEEFGGEGGQPLEKGKPIHWRNFSVAVKNAWEQGHAERPFDICWFVSPNDEYNPQALSSKYAARWKSCWFEKGQEYQALDGGEGFLRESGYRLFPFLCPRWDVVGEDTYGTDAPGWVALGDVKQLQFMSKKKAKLIDKFVDPPVKAPNSLRNQKVSLLPGDLTFVDEREAGKGLAPVHELKLEGMNYLIQDMAEVRMRIDSAYFADLFLMLARSDYARSSGAPVTAREIEERHEEKLLALGPVLERLNDELLDPLIDRTIDIMSEAGAIPRPPQQLEGMPLKVEYVSIMAQAQKLAGIAGIDRFVGSLITMAQVQPDVLHKWDAMQTVDEYGDKLGVPPRLVRSDEEAEARLDAAQQAAAVAQQAELAKTAGQGAQALGNAPTQGGTSTLLDDVLGAVA